MSDEPSFEFPYSEAVLRLFHQARTAESKAARVKAMMELARVFSKEHDLTDYSANDNWHEYIEDFKCTQMAQEQAGLRLARLIMHILDSFLADNNITPEQVGARAVRQVN